ncbi:MAG: hypothetical protein K8R54_12870 [Bacteroidales bacterium]|nr:hypothetical protein [Bacteroidales bacterium]
MFKRLFILIAVVSVVYTANGQAFEKGDVAINVGIGLGWGYINTLAPVPSFNASFEVGIVNIPDVGVIGVGGFGSFRTSWYNHGIYRDTYTNGIIAARGVFHFGFFDTGDFDLYAGVHAGIGFSKYSYTGYYYDDYISTDSYFVDDVFAGARYMMSSNFGLFAEVGYGISYLKAGITLKF